MARSRKAKQYREPTREEQKRLFTGFELTELFSEREIDDFVSVARHSIAGEFFFAHEENPRYQPNKRMQRFRRTDNYIIGIGGRQSELARFVTKNTHRQIISRRHLPCSLNELPPRLVEAVVNKVCYTIVLTTVNAMRHSGEIWYDEALGIWGIRQSTVDGFVTDRASRQETRRALKYDDRSYHGRPGRDRGSIPEGVSISFA